MTTAVIPAADRLRADRERLLETANELGIAEALRIPAEFPFGQPIDLYAGNGPFKADARGNFTFCTYGVQAISGDRLEPVEVLPLVTEGRLKDNQVFHVHFGPRAYSESGLNSIKKSTGSIRQAGFVGVQGILGGVGVVLAVESGFMDEPVALVGKTNVEMAHAARRFGFTTLGRYITRDDYDLPDGFEPTVDAEVLKQLSDPEVRARNLVNGELEQAINMAKMIYGEGDAQTAYGILRDVMHRMRQLPEPDAYYTGDPSLRSETHIFAAYPEFRRRVLGSLERTLPLFMRDATKVVHQYEAMFAARYDEDQPDTM